MHEAIVKNPVIQGALLCQEKGKLSIADEEGVYKLLDEECAKAHQRGKCEGEKIGYEKAKEEFGALLTLLQTIADRCLEEKKRLFDLAKPEIIEFAIVAIEKVVRMELSQPERLAKLIESFIVHATPILGHEVLKIFLSPQDLVMMEDQLLRINYDKKEVKGVRFFSDPQMALGDVRIETKGALLNFALSREMEDLRSKVLTQ